MHGVLAWWGLGRQVLSTECRVVTEGSLPSRITLCLIGLASGQNKCRGAKTMTELLCFVGASGRFVPRSTSSHKGLFD